MAHKASIHWKHIYQQKMWRTDGIPSCHLDGKLVLKNDSRQLNTQYFWLFAQTENLEKSSLSLLWHRQHGQLVEKEIEIRNCYKEPSECRRLHTNTLKF